MQLTKNVQLWNTPGHTAQDVTVMVHNVSCCGIIAVAGKRQFSPSSANNDAIFHVTCSTTKRMPTRRQVSGFKKHGTQ